MMEKILALRYVLYLTLLTNSWQVAVPNVVVMRYTYVLYHTYAWMDGWSSFSLFFLTVS